MEFSELPSLVLEKILTKLDLTAKSNLLIASEANKELNLKMQSLSYIKRPKFCPFCILKIGTDYEKESYDFNIKDLHNQMLNRASGDGNWVWTVVDDKFKLKKAFNSENLDWPISCHLGEDREQCFSIIFALGLNPFSKRSIILNHFKSLYNVELLSFIKFNTKNDLYTHILNAHKTLFHSETPINDIASLELYFEKFMFNESPVFKIPSIFDLSHKEKITQYLLVNIACTYLVFIHTVEDIMSMPLESESSQSYFNEHLKFTFLIACFTIKSVSYLTDEDNYLSESILIRVKRMLKLFEVLKAILNCII